MSVFGLKFEWPTLTGATAYVVVDEHQRDEGASILLTPDCASIEELEANIAELHANLDRVLAEGKRQFALAEANPQSVFRLN